MDVTQGLLLIEDCDGNLDIMGGVNITMGVPRRHWFCVGFITRKERMAMDTGVFATKITIIILVRRRVHFVPRGMEWRDIPGFRFTGSV